MAENISFGKALLGGGASALAGAIQGFTSHKGGSTSFASPAFQVNQAMGYEKPLLDTTQTQLGKETPIREPFMKDESFDARKIDRTDPLRSIDIIHADIANWMTTINKNVGSVFNYVRDIKKDQDGKFRDIRNTFSELAKRDRQLEERFEKFRKEMLNRPFGKGERGDEGERGSKGNQGIMGIPGLPGAKGATGEAGRIAGSALAQSFKAMSIAEEAIRLSMDLKAKVDAGDANKPGRPYGYWDPRGWFGGRDMTPEGTPNPNIFERGWTGFDDWTKSHSGYGTGGPRVGSRPDGSGNIPSQPGSQFNVNRSGMQIMHPKSNMGSMPAPQSGHGPDPIRDFFSSFGQNQNKITNFQQSTGQTKGPGMISGLSLMSQGMGWVKNQFNQPNKTFEQQQQKSFGGDNNIPVVTPGNYYGPPSVSRHHSISPIDLLDSMRAITGLLGGTGGGGGYGQGGYDRGGGKTRFSVGDVSRAVSGADRSYQGRGTSGGNPTGTGSNFVPTGDPGIKLTGEHDASLSGVNSGANFMHQNPGLQTVTLDNGKKITVAGPSAPHFQGFLNDLLNAGAPIGNVGGYNPRPGGIAGTGRPSQHSYGNAMDIFSQSGRDIVSPAGRKWVQEHPKEWRGLLNKWGIYSGGDWRNPDFGHIEWSGKPTFLDEAELKRQGISINEGAPQGGGTGEHASPNVTQPAAPSQTKNQPDYDTFAPSQPEQTAQPKQTENQKKITEFQKTAGMGGVGYRFADDIPDRMKSDVQGTGRLEHYPSTITQFGGEQGGKLVSVLKSSLSAAHYSEWEQTGILDPAKLTESEYNKIKQTDPNIAKLVVPTFSQVPKSAPQSDATVSKPQQTENQKKITEFQKTAGMSQQQIQQQKQTPTQDVVAKPQSKPQQEETVQGSFKGFKQDRQKFAEELEAKPWLKEKIFKIAQNEQSDHPGGAQGVMESMMNRASVKGVSLEHEATWKTDHGYYDDRQQGRHGHPYSADRAKVYEGALRNTLAGQDTVRGAYDNASGSFARGEESSPAWEKREEIHGEHFLVGVSPGAAKVPYAAWKNWYAQKLAGGSEDPPPGQPPPGPQYADFSKALAAHAAAHPIGAAKQGFGGGDTTSTTSKPQKPQSRGGQPSLSDPMWEKFKKDHIRNTPEQINTAALNAQNQLKYLHKGEEPTFAKLTPQHGDKAGQVSGAPQEGTKAGQVGPATLLRTQEHMVNKLDKMPGSTTILPSHFTPQGGGKAGQTDQKPQSSEPTFSSRFYQQKQTPQTDPIRRLLPEITVHPRHEKSPTFGQLTESPSKSVVARHKTPDPFEMRRDLKSKISSGPGFGKGGQKEGYQVGQEQHEARHEIASGKNTYSGGPSGRGQGVQSKPPQSNLPGSGSGNDQVGPTTHNADQDAGGSGDRGTGDQPDADGIGLCSV